ncbi:MAG: hypothetical protein DID90_2727554313 [Candidatus Nitrotoga sp. LAW]|nr:MAG: hypothetical protein DID90_2727554313 [Candidatus Nitrotoga sp. LAW]
MLIEYVDFLAVMTVFESLERYHIKIQSNFPTNIGEWLLVLTVSMTRCGSVQIDNLG